MPSKRGKSINVLRSNISKSKSFFVSYVFLPIYGMFNLVKKAGFPCKGNRMTNCLWMTLSNASASANLLFDEWKHLAWD